MYLLYTKFEKSTNKNLLPVLAERGLSFNANLFPLFYNYHSLSSIPTNYQL
jgi:hypothetical protein